MPQVKECKGCKGTGKCTTCNGRGRMGGLYDEKCKKCGGTGNCTACRGTGKS